MRILEGVQRQTIVFVATAYINMRAKGPSMDEAPRPPRYDWVIGMMEDLGLEVWTIFIRRDYVPKVLG